MNHICSQRSQGKTVFVSVFSVGVLYSGFAARAATKKERTPPFSQVASTVTGKVIDYTPRRADRARQVPH